VKLINLIKMIYTLKMFNTGQVTLPKKWREECDTSHFVAEETQEGLLIKPLEEKSKEIVYYENKDEFGIYCEAGLPVDKIIAKIQELHGED
jgi:bifunctional DNA-binding transcriptional regulator/antitoxin component of YhaV-PrlF toxin-antitoxin module